MQPPGLTIDPKREKREIQREKAKRA
jgi:WD40 repeat protein